jgi:hypothetical protein
MDSACCRLRFTFANLFRIILILATLAGGTGCSHDGVSQLLFVTVPERRQILIYRSSAAGSASPLQVITERAPDEPVDVAVDFIGDAFVANAAGSVRVYAAGKDNKFRIFKNYEGSNTQLVHPTAIAVNKVGSFYVADSGNGRGRLEWFSGGANGNLVPDRVITGDETGIHDPRGVALDGSGRVFVADRTSNQVLVFDADVKGDATPVVRLGGVRAPGHLAVDDLVNVYVVSDADDSITVFGSSGPQSWTLGAKISSKALRDPTGVTTDFAGDIVAGATGGVLFFASNAQGMVDPVRSLTWSDPFHPGGICIH